MGSEKSRTFGEVDFGADFVIFSKIDKEDTFVQKLRKNTPFEVVGFLFAKVNFPKTQRILVPKTESLTCVF